MQHLGAIGHANTILAHLWLHFVGTIEANLLFNYPTRSSLLVIVRLLISLHPVVLIF